MGTLYLRYILINMVKHGTRPTKIDHRDYDFHKTFGAFKVAPFLPTYNTDVGLTMPNQEVVNTYFSPAVPALPFGCTDYTTSELEGDLKNEGPFSPELIENITHANANGGGDIRQSLLAGKSLGWFTGIFNIRALGQDYFDAVRDAMVSGGTEKRSVSVGTPWYPDFESIDYTGILPIPRNFNDPNLTWHNWKICGWKTINDQVYLVVKSWQGIGYGDKGFCYMSRSLFNQLMAIPGAVAFTTTSGTLPPIETITTTWLEWFISYARNLLPY